MVLAVGKYATFSSIPSVETVDVVDAKLPTMFICPKDYFQYESLEDLGYKYAMLNFLRGKLDGTGNDFVSWEGNTSLPYQNLTRLAFKSFTNTFLAVNGIPADNWNFNQETIKESFTALDGYCVKIDIDATNSYQSDLFQTEVTSFSDFKIYFAGPEKSLHYKIDDESTIGDPILVIPSTNMDTVYRIEFEQIHWMEESGECTNYGADAEFMSLADCVLNEHDKIFQPILGCLVPWLAPLDYPGICTGRVQITEDTQKKLFGLIDLVTGKIKGKKITEQFPKCKKPCMEVRAHSKLRCSETMIFPKTILSFQRRVKVTRYLRDYGLFDLVVEVGSSLGLWVGLSALGIFDLLQHALTVTRHVLNAIV